MVRTRRSDYSGEGSGSDGGESRSATKKRGGGHDRQCQSLVGKAWTMIKQLFFLIVHIYRSLTAFWSQMHVCMLPALGELDNEENPGQDGEDELDQQQATPPPPASPQRKRAAKAD